MKPCLLLAGLLAAPLAAPMTADEPKTHVLYLGADISVQWRGEPRRVVDAQGDQLVIDADGKRITLAAATATQQLRLDSALKLADVSAHLSGLKGATAYSAENNPHQGTETALALAQGADTMADLAAANLRETQMWATMGKADGTVNPGFEEKLPVAHAQFNETQAARLSATQATDGNAPTMGETHDALSLGFELSAPRRLEHPYVVVVVRYLEQPGNPATRRVLAWPQALARVDETPRRVRMFRRGFPPGYELERYDVHLYDGDREVPTTASARRVELTAEEAFQYAVVTHLANPAQETSPPLPAREFWPAGLTSRLEAGNRNRLVYVRVDKDGRATGAFHDEAGRLPVTDADVQAVLPELRFLPAVQKGRAVPGMCQVSLGNQPM